MLDLSSYGIRRLDGGVAMVRVTGAADFNKTLVVKLDGTTVATLTTVNFGGTETERTAKGAANVDIGGGWDDPEGEFLTQVLHAFGLLFNENDISPLDLAVRTPNGTPIYELGASPNISAGGHLVLESRTKKISVECSIANTTVTNP